MRIVAYAALTAASVTALAACAGQPVAVRVAGTAIARTQVSHWMALLAPEHLVPDPPSYSACVARERLLSPSSAKAALERECRQQYRALERRALDFLIASAWVRDTATADGLRVSDREVEQRLREYPAPAPAEAGDGADQKLVVATEVADAKLRERLARGEPPVSANLLVSYYRAHRGRFLIPERRYLDIENLKTPAQALAIKREVQAGAGASFTRGILHEVIEQPSPVSYDPAEQAARRVILAARPHVLTGPVFTGEYSLFEVTRIIPARYRSFARVRGAIASQLVAQRRRTALSRFIREWRRRWIARTDCLPGYVVQKCRQYAGPMQAEDQLAFR